MKQLLDIYYRLLQRVMLLLMGLMVVPVFMQILSRYTGVIPRYIWTEEIARFCFVWVIMIGSMIAVRDSSHFEVDLLPRAHTRKEEAVCSLVVHCAMAVLALVFSWYGADFAGFGYRQTSEMSGINMLSIYVAFPLAGMTWAVFLLEKLIADVRVIAGLDPGE